MASWKTHPAGTDEVGGSFQRLISKELRRRYISSSKAGGHKWGKVDFLNKYWKGGKWTTSE
jgi:hypothetical protein